jgi:hypothetical protein
MSTCRSSETIGEKNSESGEDVRAVPLGDCSDQRPIEVVDALADVRGRADPLTMALRRDLVTRNSLEEALTKWVPRRCRWRASLWRRFCATTIEAAGGVASSGLRPSRAVPNGLTPSTVPGGWQGFSLLPWGEQLETDPRGPHGDVDSGD